MARLSNAAPRLIAPDELVPLLDDPAVVVIEIAFADDDTAFRTAHVPGSRWAYWKRLLWHATDREFPDASVIAERLGALGVPAGATIVLSGDPVQFGTYAFWVLQMLGCERLLLLDGGRMGWLEGGFPVESGSAASEPASYSTGGADLRARVGRDGVLESVGRGDGLILDLRSEEEYRGERVAPATAPFDHGAERKGRIPGAVHLPHQRLVADHGRFRTVAELRAAVEAVGVGPETDVITYCRLSHRASLGWFVLSELLGHERVRVYDGSWTEWGSIVGVPIELGPVRAAP
ncbi:MAG TPA: sulfurtransferase [Gaiellaceae bacterium]